MPETTRVALEAWLAVHPLARGRGLRDEQPLFVRLGRFAGAEPPEPLSAQSVHKLVRACALAAGVPERLAHPHALRTYWATSLLEDGVPLHPVSRPLRPPPPRAPTPPAPRAPGRPAPAALRPPSRYAADPPDHVDDVADVLDCRHQATRRARR